MIMRQYQKNGKMTMRLRPVRHAPGRCHWHPGKTDETERFRRGRAPGGYHGMIDQAVDGMCDAGPGPASYSITSSARAMSEGGTVRPSALAVLRFITISNLVG